MHLLTGNVQSCFVINHLKSSENLRLENTITGAIFINRPTSNNLELSISFEIGPELPNPIRIATVLELEASIVEAEGEFVYKDVLAYDAEIYYKTSDQRSNNSLLTFIISLWYLYLVIFGLCLWGCSRRLSFYLHRRRMRHF